MTREKKLIPSINRQLIICYVFLLNLAHAKGAVESTLSSNSIDETTQINGKAVKGEVNETIKKTETAIQKIKQHMQKEASQSK